MLAGLTLRLLVADFGQGHIQSLKKRVNSMTIMFLSMAVPFEIVLVMFAPKIEHLLYQGTLI